VLRVLREPPDLLEELVEIHILMPGVAELLLCVVRAVAVV